jgi:hypothetical protein
MYSVLTMPDKSRMRITLGIMKERSESVKKKLELHDQSDREAPATFNRAETARKRNHTPETYRRNRN